MKIINVTGEQLYKLTAHLPNYKTRHKHKRRKIQPSIYERTKMKKKRTAVSKILKIMSLSVQRDDVKIYSNEIPQRERSTNVHTDYHTSTYDIYVDNCASRSITNCMEDFVDEPIPADICICGTNGTSKGTLMGTVEWEIEDDQGRTHKIRVPNTIYSANNRSRLLSPQHWAQGANDKYPIRYGTWCATYDDRIILYWDQRRYSRTAYLLNENSNIGVIRGVRNMSGEKHYARIAKAFRNEIIAMPAVLETIRHSVDEYEDEQKEEPTMSPEESQGQDRYPMSIQRTIDESDYDDYEKVNYELKLDDLTSDLRLDQIKTSKKGMIDPQQEYLHWHYKLGHLSHTRMR
jgi:hypothetical protein